MYTKIQWIQQNWQETKIKVRNEEELFNIFLFKLITNIKQISNYKIKREKEKWK